MLASFACYINQTVRAGMVGTLWVGRLRLKLLSIKPLLHSASLNRSWYLRSHYVNSNRRYLLHISHTKQAEQRLRGSTCNVLGNRHLLKIIFTYWRYWHGFQLNRCVRCIYCPWDKTAVHDGKSELFSPINFWIEWGLFSCFYNQRSGQFCFDLSHMIIQVIFGKDEIVLWWKTGTQVVCHSALHAFLLADPPKTSGITVKKQGKWMRLT